jgi:methionyl-tRNA formyltransferase
MLWSTSPGPAGEIYNRWRGFQPWPGAYTFFRGKS